MTTPRIGDVAVIGNLTVDEIAWARAVPPLDEVSVVEDQVVSLGGRGAIVTLALRALGAEARLCTVTGRVPTEALSGIPPWMRMEAARGDALEAIFGPTLAVEPDAAPTRVLVCVGRAERNCISLLWPGTRLPPPTKLQGEAINAASLVYCTTHDLAFNKLALRGMSRASRRVIYNLSESMWTDPEFLDLVESTALAVIVNGHEAAGLGRSLGVATAGQLRRALSVPTLVVTRGEDGADVHLDSNEGPPVRVPVVKVPVVAPVGAGDAFAAGFVFGTAQGWSAIRSCELGAKVAAISVSSRTSYPDLHRVRESTSG